MSKTKYPECEKINIVSKESNAIGAFIDWLKEKHDIHLGEFKGTICPECEEVTENLVLIYPNMEDLLANFFDIDLAKAEQERQEILKNLRDGK